MKKDLKKTKKDYSGYCWSVSCQVHINHSWRKLSKEEIKELKKICIKAINKYMENRWI